MKLAQAVALSVFLLGLGACATTSTERYYVSGDGQGGDYYIAPVPRDDFYGSYYGGYCPWSAFACGFGYNDWRYFSFGFSYGPWWGYPPYFYGPPPPHERHQPQAQAGSWPDQPQDMPPPRRGHAQDSREPSRNEPSRSERSRSESSPMRAEPSRPEPPQRNREKRDGSPPATV